MGNKLRSSCDNCHVAKVRCTPTSSQSCARCLSHNVPCSYSPSLRVNNKSNQSTGSREQSSSSNATSTPASPDRSRTQSVSNYGVQTYAAEGLHDPFFGSGTDLSGLNGGGGLGSATFSSSLNGIGNGNHANTSTDMEMNDLNMDDVGTLPTPPTTSRSGSMSVGSAVTPNFMQPNFVNPNAFNAPPVTDFTPHLDSNLSFWTLGGIDRHLASTAASKRQDEEERPENATLECDSCEAPQTLTPTRSDQQRKSLVARPTAKATGNAFKSDSMTRNTNSPCNCHFCLLENLKSIPQAAKFARSNGQDNSVGTLDVILASNKRSIGCCTTYMNCPCSEGSTSFLLIVTMLSQVLALYHSACENFLDPKHVRAVSGLGSNGSSDIDDGGAGGETIVPGPLRLHFGSYELEEEDEVLLKKELMLIELRKVESLLVRLRGTLEVEGESGGGGGGEEREPRAALLAWLMKGLRRTVGVVQPRR